MNEVTIRELLNRGGLVLDWVTRGEAVTVTRDGHPVAELRPLPRHPLPAATLLGRWRRLAAIDAAKLRADLDAVLDARVVRDPSVRHERGVLDTSTGRKTAARAYDAMVAATAMAHDLPVYTCNPQDFAGIEGLTVVSLAVLEGAP